MPVVRTIKTKFIFGNSHGGYMDITILLVDFCVSGNAFLARSLCSPIKMPLIMNTAIVIQMRVPVTLS